MHLQYGAEGIDQSDFLKAFRKAGHEAYEPIRTARSYGELKPMNDLAIGIATLMRDAIDAGMDSATSPFLNVWSSWANTRVGRRNSAVSACWILFSSTVIKIPVLPDTEAKWVSRQVGP